MPLEDIEGPGRYINDLNNAWPLGTDEKREGDNHIRGIKNVLQNTVVDGSGNPLSQEMFNVYTTLFYAKNNLLPVGTVMAWFGNRAEIDALAEWAICDGTNGTPNLIDRYLVGGSNDSDVTGGQPVGTNTQTSVAEHNHGNGSLATVSHNHTLTANSNNAAIPAGSGPAYGWVNGSNNNQFAVTGNPIAASPALDVTGSTSNTGSAGGVDNRPESLRVWWIIRVA